jgi:hypothetical protein
MVPERRKRGKGRSPKGGGWPPHGDVEVERGDAGMVRGADNEFLRVGGE